MIGRVLSWKRRAVLVLTATVCGSLPTDLWAAGRVEILISGQSQLGAGYHQWSRILSDAGAARVQIGTGKAADQPAIAVQGSPDLPTYVVTGAFNARGELLLPGARFAPADAARLRQWIADLAQNGPPERRENRSAFGLTATQFQLAHEDLSRAVGTPTQGLTRDEVLQHIASRLTRPLRLEARTAQELRQQKVAEDLATLSCGTALACVLRPAGYCFVPQASGGELHYRVLASKGQQSIWPVGWEPKKPERDLLPALYEFLNVNIQNVPASTAMEAIAKRLSVPLLLDHSALARHGVEPQKVMVTLPSGRSTYSLTLKKALFQAGLKFEVRLDEADRPLLWITTIKPL